ncbi:LOW QUALITY PROTEIN: hypothetical protein HID58_055570, partial [Brassica napus]
TTQTLEAHQAIATISKKSAERLQWLNSFSVVSLVYAEPELHFRLVHLLKARNITTFNWIELMLMIVNRDFSFWYIVLAVIDMLLIGSRVSIQSHQSGLICHPRRFSNAAWIWNLGFCSYQTMSFVLSGILTHLPAFGVLFDNEEVKGPMIQYLIRPEEYIKRFHPIGLEKLQFVEDSLKILRQEVEEHAKLTAFKYSIYGGGQLTPEMWEPWSKPYLERFSYEYGLLDN